MNVAESLQFPTPVHGHCEIEGPGADAGPRPLIVGFHGYAETATLHLAALRAIPGIAVWRRCAVQGLHPFYRAKTGEVVAGWMTRFNRELAVADNVRYVAEAVRRVKAGFPTRDPLVYLGFSQGTAMAYRAAAGAGHPARGLVALGGDLPPELTEGDLADFPRVLIGRGTTDPWYSEEKLAADAAFLAEKGVAVEVCRFEGGHEWSDVFYRSLGAFLAELGG